MLRTQRHRNHRSGQRPAHDFQIGIILRSSETLPRSGALTTESKADYAYDPATGRLASVADASSSFAYGYVDHSQNLLQSITGPVHTVTNTFEANRDALLTKANRRNSDASDISSIGYTVNAIGQRTHATRTGAATNSTDWGYDSLGQVVQADDSENTSDRAYQYDTIGNRQKTVNGLLGALPTAPN